MVQREQGRKVTNGPMKCPKCGADREHLNRQWKASVLSRDYKEALQVVFSCGDCRASVR